MQNSEGAANGKSEIITPPFPWATNRRAKIHSLKYLLQNNITTITGSVRCRSCWKDYQMELDLVDKMAEVCKFIQKNKDSMRERAPQVWLWPVFLTCEHCGGEKSVVARVAHDKRDINWLFLFLSQMLGRCHDKELNYFCKRTNGYTIFRTDRLLYSVYMGLCNQLLHDLNLSIYDQPMHRRNCSTF